MDRVLVDYFAAWNETDRERRGDLLRRSVSNDAELIDPAGRWSGADGLCERIANYHAAAPGTTVVPASGIDTHNGIERYAWKIVDRGGTEVMEGLDITERDADGRLQRSSKPTPARASDRARSRSLRSRPGSAPCHAIDTRLQRRTARQVLAGPAERR